MTLCTLLNFQKFTETRQVGREPANTSKIWQQVARFVLGPLCIALPIVRVDVQGESAKAAIKSLVRMPVAEGLAQPYFNDRVFLDAGVKEASNPVDA